MSRRRNLLLVTDVHVRARRVTKILEINKETKISLRLDNGEVIENMQPIQRHKLLRDGVLINCDDEEMKPIRRFKFNNSILPEYATPGKTGYTLALDQSMTALRQQYNAVTMEHNMPADLVYGKSAGMDSDDDSSTVSSLSGAGDHDTTVGTKKVNSQKKQAAPALTTVEEEIEDKEGVSIHTNNVNYHAVVLAGTTRRDVLEQTARKGQEKQANDVNRARFDKDGEVIAKWTICSLSMPHNRNEFTPKNLPVVVCGNYYYNNSNSCRYRYVPKLLHCNIVLSPITCILLTLPW